MPHPLRFATELAARPLLGLSLAAAALADKPTRLSLMAPDSLAGWDYGPPLHSWKVVGTTLVGGADASPLLSGWTLAIFRCG